jgi:hypothetical protein
MLDGLAFLPLADVPAGMAYLRSHIPDDDDGLRDLLNYFDETYVSGSMRLVAAGNGSRSLVRRMRRTPPPYPPRVWNVHQATVDGTERTNNVCEGWNNAFANLVGHHHPSVFTLLRALQEDQALAATEILHDAQGRPPTKRIKRATEQHQARLQTLCSYRRDGTKSVEETIIAVGHCVRLMK